MKNQEGSRRHRQPVFATRRWLALCAAGLAGFHAGSAPAATVTKNDTITMKANTTDWSAAPGTTDIGSFTGTPSATTLTNLTLGANLSIGELLFNGTLNGDVAINYVSGQTLTLNSGTAIVATSQNHNITVDCPVTVTTAGNTFQAVAGGAYTITFGPQSYLTGPGSGTVIWRGGTGIFGGGGNYTTLGIGSTAGNTSAVKLGANNGVATNAIVDIAEANGTANFDLAGYNQTLAGITMNSKAGSIGNSSTNSDSTLTTTGTSLFAGVIQDVLGAGTHKVALTVNGGSLTLTGTNTFSGATAISAGTLALATNGALASTPTLTLASNATFDVTALTAGSYSFTGSGPAQTLAAGSSAGTAYLTAMAKTVVLNSGANLSFQAAGGATIGKLSVAGNLTLNANAVTVNVTGSALAAGTYRLLDCTGTLANTGSFGPPAMTGTALSGTVASLSVTTGAAGHLDLVVTPVWTMTYNGNGSTGGSVPVDGSSPYLNGATVTVLGNTGSLTKSGGYSFNGWNTAASGLGGTAYSAGNTLVIAGNTILYAQWNLAAATITAPANFPAAVSTTYGTAASPQSVSVSGSGLGAAITATSTNSGLEISSDGTTYGSTASFAASGGSAAGTLYVRLKDNASVGGSYDSQNIILTSLGATPVNVATVASGDTVTAKALTVAGATAQSKMYDGTTAATVVGTLAAAEAFGTGSSGDGLPYTGDTLTVACPGSTFASSAVGTGISVTAGTFGLGGSSAGNYTLTQPSLSLNAAILNTAVWTNTVVTATWGAAANWTNAIVGTNAGNTADFSQVDIAADVSVNLTTPMTIGNLVFGNTDPSPAANWTLANNATSANILTLAGSAPTVTVNSLGAGKSATISAAVAGTSGLIKAGPGLLILSGTNTYTGNTTITGGTLVLGGPGQWGGGSYAGNLTNSGALVLSNSTGQTLSGTLSGPGPVTSAGSGTNTFSGANTYSGGTVFGGGVLVAGSAAAFGTGNVTLTNAAVRLNLTDGVTLTNSLVIAGGSPATGGLIQNTGTGTATLAGGTITISAAGNQEDFGSAAGGTLVVADPVNATVAIGSRGGTVVLSGGGSYPGYVIASTLGGLTTNRLGANNGFATNAILTVGSANGTSVFDLAGCNQTLAGITNAGKTGVIGNSSAVADATLTITGTNTFGGSGTIQDAVGAGTHKVALTVNGGALTLTGKNTYSGNTTVTAGTLVLGAAGSISNTAAIGLAAGATLDVSAITGFNLSSSTTLSAAGTGNAAVIIGATGGTVNLGSQPVLLTVDGSHPALTVSAGGLQLNGNAFTVNSASPLAPGVYTLVSAPGGSSGSGPFSLAGTAVPAGSLGAVSVSGNNVILTVGTTAMSLVSAAPVNGYLAPLTFTATVQTNGSLAGNAGGYVLFETNGLAFSSNNVAGGTVTSTAFAALPRGTNIIAAVYSGDANYLGSSATLNQVVTNHPPVAQWMTATRTAGLGLLISLADVATNWSDADGDAVTLAGINLTTTNGVNLATNGAWLLYTNGPAGADRISYLISDGQGGTNTGYISIAIAGSVTGTNSITQIQTGNPTVVTAYGVPGFTYVLERTTNLVSAVWVNVATNPAAGNGLINATDGFSDLGGNPPAAAYYQLKWQP